MMVAVFAALLVGLSSTRASAQLNVMPKEIEGLELVERLGDSIPLELTFKDSQSRTVRLGDWFDDERPVVLALVYYRCPVVCTLLMERMVESMRGLDFEIGQDFNVVYLSIDDTENPTIAAGKKMELLAAYARGSEPHIVENWAFLTGDAISIKQVADAVGYPFRRLPNGEYSHPIVFMMMSPDGRVMQYMYGFEQPTLQMNLALLNASEGTIVPTMAQRIMLFCYQLDPNAGIYTLRAMQVMRLAGGVTVVLLVMLIGGLFVYERRRRAAARNRNLESSREAEVAKARGVVGHVS